MRTPAATPAGGVPAEGLIVATSNDLRAVFWANSVAALKTIAKMIFVTFIGFSSPMRESLLSLSTYVVVGDSVSGAFLPVNGGLLQAFDLRANRSKLFFDFFVAAIEVVNTVDNRQAVGDKGGDNQRCAGTKVRRDHGCAA